MLTPLTKLPHYEMESAPDVLGWDAFDREERKIGTVEDMLVDDRPDEDGLRSIHYLSIRKDHCARLVPSDWARVDSDQRRVTFPECSVNDFERFPEYRGGDLDENQVNQEAFEPPKRAEKFEKPEKPEKLEKSEKQEDRRIRVTFQEAGEAKEIEFVGTEPKRIEVEEEK